MKNLIKILLAIFSIGQVSAQTNGCGSPPNLTVNATCITQTFNNNQNGTNSAGIDASCGNFTTYEDAWYTITGTGNTVSITMSGSNRDGTIAAYTGCNTGEITCDFAFSGGAANITFPTTLGTTYYIQIQRQSGNNSNNMNGDICAVDVIPASNSDCSSPEPVCSGSPINFTTVLTGLDAEDDINTGNDYGCLGSSPDPTWYYLEIANSGDLAIDMSAASDIDYAIWGPFADLTVAEANCDSYGTPLDCSYSTSATEQANVAGAIAGEVYVMVVTNYAGSIQTINISDAPGNTATTDCSIVLPVELVHFDGMQVRNENILTWTTVSELNNDYFVVERSLDGKIWSAFDIIAGQGTTTSTSYYESIDSNPQEGTNYYRLKQFDSNGSISLSDVIAIVPNNNITVNLIPNPAKSNVIINTNEYFNSIQIFNLQGREVFMENFNSIRKASIDINELEKGVYNVVVNTEKGSKIERLVVM